MWIRKYHEIHENLYTTKFNMHTVTAHDVIYTIEHNVTNYRIVGFSRYLNSANASISVFSQFYFHEWPTWKAHMIQCYQAKCCIINILIFGQFFWGLKFHKLIKCAKFTEFKYLEKTNYTVNSVSCHSNRTYWCLP